MDDLNKLIKAENNRRDWGQYSFSNGKGVVKLPYTDIPLRMETNKLVMNTNKKDHAFIKLNAVDGINLNGTYIMEEWNGAIPSINFTNDGKFSDKGAIRILYHEYVDCLNAALSPGAGTYEVKNRSMIFNYNDGRKIKIAFTEPGKANSLSTIALSFNNDVLRKQ